MRVHVIYAAPDPNSFSAAIHATILRRLRAAGHEVDDLDLYAEGFWPVLSRSERAAYYAVGANLTGIETYVARLRAAEALVVCFPTWWNGMPAILKGYFDRIWVPGVAFRLATGGGLQPGLTHVRKLAVVTTAGSPWWLLAVWMGNPNRGVLMRALRGLLAKRARCVFLCYYGMDRSTPKSRARFLERVDHAFAHF